VETYLEVEQTEKLEGAATCLRDKLLIRLLAKLGCRVSEALSLTVEDVDFTQGVVTIQHLKSRIKLSCPMCGASLGRRHVYCPRCGVAVGQVVAREQERRRLRTLPLEEETLALLKEHIERGGTVNRKGKQLIFGINRHRAWQIVRECAGRASLPRLVNPETGRVHNVSPHRLRDAFAVHAVRLDDSGDGLRLLQKNLA
jgi:integrase/recombinase XerD